MRVQIIAVVGFETEDFPTVEAKKLDAKCATALREVMADYFIRLPVLVSNPKVTVSMSNGEIEQEYHYA